MMEARLLRPEEAGAYAVLRAAALMESPWAFLASPEDDVPAAEVARRLGDPENAIIAVFDPGDAGRMVAMAGVARPRRVKTMHRAVIWGVYVDPAWRGRGLSRVVMAKAIETARSWPGAEVIWLSTSVVAEAALGLYESMGFERWGVEPDAIRIDGQPYDEVHFVLRIDG